ncbi:hypothetical protein [Psittacicella gerlachiana]|uniref:Uncharacterized protein n=1 Tax=Psittacicella gerlachiana TaxID=2028574 RepID=A0A3A1YCZ2_9GAMM|nr:hypothetical protein [Psittacicella gerlachiana]RIY34084.1 hypothetical protein CKF59_05840 [Psittacicella gerlachiana]
MEIEKRFINLAMYDGIVRAKLAPQLVHNEIMSFNGAFDRNPGNYKDYIEITGCETPIFMVLETHRLTFICKSKVLRSYIFALLINYMFDKKFEFETFLTKYAIRSYLSDKRIESLKNLYDLVIKLDQKDVKTKLDMHGYTFARSRECKCEHCGCREQPLDLES